MCPLASVLIRARSSLSMYYPPAGPPTPGLPQFVPAETGARSIREPATAAQKQATRILPDLPETRCSSPESLSLPRRRPPPESLTASPDRYEQTVARAPPAARPLGL